MFIALIGPTGSGKNHLMELLKSRVDFNEALSTTTRAPREGEVDGTHYRFVSKEGFEKLLAQGKMAEYTINYGDYYGVQTKDLHQGKNYIAILNFDGIEQLASKRRDLLPFFITAEEDIRMKRALSREENPDNRALLKRFKEDPKRFSIKQAMELGCILIDNNGSDQAAINQIMQNFERFSNEQAFQKASKMKKESVA